MPFALMNILILIAFSRPNYLVDRQSNRSLGNQKLTETMLAHPENQEHLISCIAALMPYKWL